MTVPTDLPAPLGALRLWWRDLTAPAPRDPALPGDVVAWVDVAMHVPVVLSLMGDGRVAVRGRLSLRRVGRGGRARAARFAHAVALADLPD